MLLLLLIKIMLVWNSTDRMKNKIEMTEERLKKNVISNFDV